MNGNVKQCLRLFRLVREIETAISIIGVNDLRISDMYRYATSTGHRSRSLATLLSCEAVGGRWIEAVPAAVAVELGHKASLIHDDLVDGDEYRGTRRAFHAVYGFGASVVMGDLLMSLAFDALKELKRDAATVERCYRLFSHAYRVAALGEMQDVDAWELSSDKTVATEDSILRLHYRKTGILGELAFQLGAVIGRCTPEEFQYLGNIGRDLGIAFQLLNDINNWTGREASVSRAAKSDLQSHRPNIVSCLLFKSLSNESRSVTHSSQQHASAQREIHADLESLAIGQAYALVDRLCIRVRHSLNRLPPSYARDIFYQIACREALLSNLF